MEIKDGKIKFKPRTCESCKHHFRNCAFAYLIEENGYCPLHSNEDDKN